MLTYYSVTYGLMPKNSCIFGKNYFIAMHILWGHYTDEWKKQKKIHKLLYRINKTAIGAVFNVNSRLSELILGTPPIEILNNMNVNRHFLKIIMVAKQHPEDNSNDCLFMHIKSLCLSESIPSALYRQLKLSYEFLNWKFKCTPEQFTAADK